MPLQRSVCVSLSKVTINTNHYYIFLRFATHSNTRESEYTRWEKLLEEILSRRLTKHAIPSQRDRPPDTTEPETDQVSGSDTDQQRDSTQASPVATLPVGVHENSLGFSMKANPFVKKSSQACKEQAEKVTPTAQNDEMGSEDGSTASETSEKSKTLGRKSPDTCHTRRVRTKESEPLTEETLVVCLKQLVSEIGREFKNTLANEKDRHRTLRKK